MKDIQFKSIFDLMKVFTDEHTCHQYLAYQRWEGVMTCPFDDCDGENPYVFKDGIRYKCSCCKKIYTAKTGTFMEASKLATVKWIMAVYLVMHKNGISSVQLAKDLGVTQKTGWFILQRIRAAFGNTAVDSLEGTVLADETFVGGKNKNRHADKKVKYSQGRSFKDKTPVLGLLEQQEYEITERPHKVIAGKTVKEKIITKHSKVLCKVIPDTSAKNIKPIIFNSLSIDSTLVSDEWKAYTGLSGYYNHHVVDHGRKEYVNELGYTTNAVEGFWNIAKRAIHGTYIRPTRKHMQKYFNEFSFRYNNKHLNVQAQIAIFASNLEGRLKYKDLCA